MNKDQLLKFVRQVRNDRLADTEKFGFGMIDRPWPEGWTEYRQALRDLPQKILSGEINYPEWTEERINFTWPEMPQSFIDMQQ